MTFSRFIRIFLCTAVLGATSGQNIAQANELRVGLIALPASLGNPFTNVGLPSGHFWGSLYDNLTYVAPNGQVQPALALTWEQVEPTRWHFTLRQDVRFHNGAPFDAQDVVTTLEYLMSEDAARHLVANEVKNIAGASALSAYDVEINTVEPDVILPRRLSLVSIIEDQEWLERGPEDYALAPVGTGPYKFVRWRNANSTVDLDAVETVLRPVRDVKRLTFVEVREAVSRQQALLSGQLDLIDALTPDSVADVKAAGFTVTVSPRAQILSIALPNLVREDSPLNAPEVRRALNLAVDRFAIAEFIYGGLVDVASQGAVEGTVGFNAALEPFPYDPAEARRLLATAGYADGFNLSIAFLQADGQSSETAYQKVGQDLAAVGVAAEVRALTASEYLRRFMANDWGPYDAFTLLWNSEPLRDAGRPLEYFSCLRPQPFFCDEEAAQIILDSRSQTDPAARQRTLEQLMARMQELAPAIWLNNMAQITASRPGITNIDMGTAGIAFENIEIRP